MVHIVYILKCFKNGIAGRGYIYYRGYTNNIQKRYWQHKKGHSKYTKQFKGNIQLIYLEEIIDRNTKNERKKALSREKQIKKWNRKYIESITRQRQKRINFLLHKYF